MPALLKVNGRTVAMSGPRGAPRLWITFWRRFWGAFSGGFWEATGPGGGVRGDFSADGVLLVRWAGGFLPFLASFCSFLTRFDRFLGPISHFFHPCHVHTFMLVTFFPRLWHGFCPPARGSVVSTQRAQPPGLAVREARSRQRRTCRARGRTQRKAGMGGTIRLRIARRPRPSAKPTRRADFGLDGETGYAGTPGVPRG